MDKLNDILNDNCHQMPGTSYYIKDSKNKSDSVHTFQSSMLKNFLQKESKMCHGIHREGRFTENLWILIRQRALTLAAEMSPPLYFIG